ncbi:hypothetical protein JY651_48035 [Pyxidicoccus parkwayensis]|uniref:Uncharacterized protein n=1 Tax=Pyxidicoccus parkwayensis TaxID=2813578 RepID=A0ABX7NV25_9BACT|nr:hypothetical protein [Pyxidicoccus parkwaysis]QSQ22766.1 hypothetical protein JY651_48035 [Pyxidicoccus parkwaysis]
MLTIDTLHLQLPAGFERRADAIARLVARELSRAPVVAEGEHRLPQAHLALQLDPKLPDAEVASRIATALVSHVRGAVEAGRAGEEGGRGW